MKIVNTVDNLNVHNYCFICICLGNINLIIAKFYHSLETYLLAATKLWTLIFSENFSSVNILHFSVIKILGHSLKDKDFRNEGPINQKSSLDMNTHHCLFVKHEGFFFGEIYISCYGCFPAVCYGFWNVAKVNIHDIKIYFRSIKIDLCSIIFFLSFYFIFNKQ